MGAQCKNYMKNGDELVIGGKLTIKDGATVTGMPTYTLPAATADQLGGVKQTAAQADSTATDAAGIVADFNTLLGKLRTAGLLAANAED